jgi:hypothetical protein
MISTLTQDIKRLSLHANFEKACTLPYAKSAIEHLCALIHTADEDFFSNNGAFEAFYEDEYATYSDFELMVHMLKELHVHTLFEDNTSDFFNAMSRYGIPSLPDEDNWGDSVDQLLDALASYWNFPAVYQVKVRPAEGNNANIADAKHVEMI